MDSFHRCVCFLVLFFLPGELYFLSTGVPSATAPNGVVYKVVDTSRYVLVARSGDGAVSPGVDDVDVMNHVG